MHMSRRHAPAILLGAIVLALGQAVADGAKRGPWDTAKLLAAPAYRESARAKADGLKALLYSGLSYRGKPTEVFAYYGAPKGKSPKDGWPAVVCIHGGGGTAFGAWVEKWNDHGYAAISMDLEGHYPISKSGSRDRRARESVDKPGPSRVGVFGDYDKPIEEQWYYHAVAQVILAHSLIRSFPEVDAGRIGVTGISWGGTLTSTTMGVDGRFKFAVPVYGCGFLPGSEGHQGRALRSPRQRAFVARHYDGSAYFKYVKIPVLWVNGTNDRHFSMPATQKSSRAVRGASILRFQKGMKHGHRPGWEPKEIYAFADSVVKDDPSLPQLGEPRITAGSASCACTSAKGISKAELFYTTDTCIWPDRKWKSIPAKAAGRTLTAIVPKGSGSVFFSITDRRGLTVTSMFTEKPNPTDCSLVERAESARKRLPSQYGKLSEATVWHRGIGAESERRQQSRI
jgi:dienelactone hydrolase